MAKRQDKSSKDSGVRTKKAKINKASSAKATGKRAATAKAATQKAMTPSQAIMEMTTKDAWKYRTIFGSARSRRSPSRGQSPLDRSSKTDK